MRKIQHALLVFVAAISAACLCIPASAAMNAYLQFPGITGESHAGTPAGAISVESFSWGMSQSSREASSGMASGRRMHKPFRIMRTIDKSSPLLMQAAMSGRHFQTATLNANGQVYRMQNAMISSYTRESNGQTESFTIDYEQLAGETTNTMMSPATMPHPMMPSMSGPPH